MLLNDAEFLAVIRLISQIEEERAESDRQWSLLLKRQFLRLDAMIGAEMRRLDASASALTCAEGCETGELIDAVKPR